MSEDGYVVRIRGLPWSATREEILDFFKDCNVRNGVDGIFMTLSREGRPSGEAYIELQTEDDYQKALDMSHKHMGSRYIEVFSSKRSEFEWISRRQGNDNKDIKPHEDAFVRLRGLPFTANKEDIMQFFSGLDLVMDGIVLPTDHSGRSTGEAYIQFASRDNADKAMTKHKEKIGHRYIEIFKSSFQEYRAVRSYMDNKPYGGGGGGGSGGHYGRNGPFGPPSHGPPSPPVYPYHKVRYGHPGRPVPYPNRFRGSPYGNGSPYNSYGAPISGASRGPPPPGASRRVYDYDDLEFRGRPPSYGGRYPYDSFAPEPPHNPFVGRHSVHMRGLPYKTTEGEIFEFFLPLRPITVHILFDDLGRPSGEADIEFATHEDALKAMNKDKAYIQKRYIELFLHSTNSSNNRNTSPFSDRFGGDLPENGNGHTRQMGGWGSTIIDSGDLVRSRV